MTLIAMTSAGRSPGVSTTVWAIALALQTRKNMRSVVLEVDPHGATLHARLTGERTRQGESSLRGVGAGLQAGSGDLDTLIETYGVSFNGVPLISTEEEPAAALETANRFGSVVGTALGQSQNWLALADLGPMFHNTVAEDLVGPAQAVVLLANPKVESISAVRHWHSQLTNRSQDVQLILVGDRPSPNRWATEAGLTPQMIIGSDPVVPELVISKGLKGGKKLERSVWWRTILALADLLADQAEKGMRSVSEVAPS